MVGALKTTRLEDGEELIMLRRGRLKYPAHRSVHRSDWPHCGTWSPNGVVYFGSLFQAVPERVSDNGGFPRT
jgi:hypothetical protein